MMNCITGWATSKHIGVALLCFGLGAQSFGRCRGAKRCAPHVEHQGDFTVIAGEILAGNLRAEIAQLRAELDLLKTDVRRKLAQI